MIYCISLSHVMTNWTSSLSWGKKNQQLNLKYKSFNIVNSNINKNKRCRSTGRRLGRDGTSMSSLPASLGSDWALIVSHAHNKHNRHYCQCSSLMLIACCGCYSFHRWRAVRVTLWDVGVLTSVMADRLSGGTWMMIWGLSRGVWPPPKSGRLALGALHVFFPHIPHQ